jgi:hypothetical protein
MPEDIRTLGIAVKGIAGVQMVFDTSWRPSLVIAGTLPIEMAGDLTTIFELSMHPSV